MNSFFTRRPSGPQVCLWLCAFGLVLGCGAVFPEVVTPLKAVPEGREVGPPPPEDILFLEIVQARIPEQTRDGRKWDSVGGAAPDPFAIVFLNDKELFRTDVEANTVAPTWPAQPRGNYRVPKGALLRIELWDSNPLNDQPICNRKLQNVHDEALTGNTTNILCPSGAELELRINEAKPKLGLGLYFELTTYGINVTRTLEESPARRAGLGRGDKIVRIQDKSVQDMEDGEAQSLINANAQLGVRLVVRHKDGKTREVELKEAAIYPIVGEIKRPKWDP